MDDDAALAGDAGDAADDALEGTGGDADEVVGGEAAGLGVYLHDMLVMDGGGADQGEDVAVAEDERGIRAAITDTEVVVVVGDEAGLEGVTDVVVGLHRGEIGEDEIQEGTEDAVLLAVLDDVLPEHGDIGIVAVGQEGGGDLLGVAVEDAEDIPALGRVWGVFYRHPGKCIFGCGEGKGGRS